MLAHGIGWLRAWSRIWRLLFRPAQPLQYISQGAIKQYEEIMEWLEVHGYNMELEGVYPCRRIEELKSNDE